MKILLQRLFLMIFLIMLSSLSSYGQKGHWLFDNPSNLTEAVPGFGNDLVLTGTASAIAGPTDGNGAVQVPKGSYFKLVHGIAPNGGGAYVNKYSLMFDFKIPDAAWHCFFQVDTAANANDGDYFIKPSGELGTAGAGYSTFTVAAETWYRLVITVDNENISKSYIDGQLIKEWNAYAIDTRYALLPSVLLFADDDGDDAEIHVAEIAIWDYPLSGAEVAALSGIDINVPVELASFNAVQANGNVLINWETITEKNNSGFIIEKKGQSGDWQSLGFVAGCGTSTDKHSYSFIDQVGGSGKYSYRLKQIDFDGSFEYSNSVEVILTPAEFKLLNNYPNPFNPATQIAYELSTDAFVTLKVYNAVGELVTELVSENQVTGKYNKSFNASSLPSGIYFTELRANEKVQRIKMMLVK